MIEPVIIDCHYLKPQFAAAFLIVEKDRAAFIENNTAHATPFLLEALKEQSIAREKVDYLIITHIHLDHAGGSFSLLQHCPQALLLAHPRAAPHLVDPSKLVSSARKVYGDAVFEKLYGDIQPIDSDRVRVMKDHETLAFGERSLHFIYTRGHANHHFCIYDSQSEGIFTGDSFGLAYPQLQKHGLFIFPATSPTDFDPKEARNSIAKILEMRPRQAFLTHFGRITDLPSAAEQLRRHIDYSEKLMHEAVQSGEPDSQLPAFCESRLKKYFQPELDKRGLASDPEVWDILRLDLELNAAGIAFAAQKIRKTAMQ
jgi:glyoxylase-like metal-dependent hydrolase (beta-lactamase superfamily II)